MIPIKNFEFLTFLSINELLLQHISIDMLVPKPFKEKKSINIRETFNGQSLN